MTSTDIPINPREEWEESFVEMAEQCDDQRLDPETSTEWNETEWAW